MVYFQKNKWTTAKKTTFAGQKFDSKFEASFAQELELRKKAGDIKSWEAHKKIPLTVNDYIVCDYYIDFVVYDFDGGIEYVETKGYATPLWRLKWKIFEALFSEKPNVKLTLVKQRSFNMRKIRKIKLKDNLWIHNY